MALPFVPLINTAAKPCAMVCTIEEALESAIAQIATDAAVALTLAVMFVKLPEIYARSIDSTDVVADAVAGANNDRRCSTRRP